MSNHIQYEPGLSRTYRRTPVVMRESFPFMSTRYIPRPHPDWQRQEYERVMGKKPPEPVSEQFDYKPRTKAGKALLEEMMGDADS